MLRASTHLPLALALILGCSPADNTPSDAGPPPGPGSISGTVFNELTAGPLTDATVVLEPLARTRLTDGTGAFSFTDLPSGSYTLRVTVGRAPCVLGTTRTVDVMAGTDADGDIPFPEPVGVVVRTLVINFDPIIESMGGARLHEAMGWNDPRELHAGYAADLELCSHNAVHHEVVEWIDADVYPVLADGFQYDDTAYQWVVSGTVPPHEPQGVDYVRIIADYNLVSRVNDGDVDEVIVWGAPWMGFYESRMAGPGAYWVNSPALPGVPTTRKFVMMGLNYERGVAEAIHSYGHRVESILWHVYGTWDSANPTHAWDLFAAYDGVLPGNSGCGNVHFPPNGAADYDYSNDTPVPSRCPDYVESWPDLTGATTDVSRSTWSTTGDDHRDYLRWWYWHLPAATGLAPDLLEAHWWKYAADFNAYPESG